MNKDDVYYEALKTRDPRFDGKFFVGVKTTGIYCRPVCPARPKRENVEFYPSALAAEKAGYRPCLRCRPESAPRSPAWIGTSAVVRRAVKVLHDQETLDFNEDRFAAAFGVSARHLRRLFLHEIGKTPKQIAQENRLNLARKLIHETSLPITEIAFAAGFGSVRRFNGAFLERFHRSPSEIRRYRAGKSESPRSLRISLSYRPPFDFEGLLEFYRKHRVGNLEWFEPGKMHRVVQWDGKLGRIALSDDPSGSRVFLDIDFPDTRAIPALVAKARALLDLDSDPVLIANRLETVPEIKALLKRNPGVRLPSGWDAFEVAVSAILGQGVSVERGRQLVEDLIDLLGENTGLETEGRRIRLFPRSAQIAKADLSKLKTTGSRRRALKEFAAAVEDGRVSLEPTQEVEKFFEAVTEIPGIGTWTAKYMAMKALRQTDAFPETDLLLARELARYPSGILDSLSPWRGYVAALLWQSPGESSTAKKTKKKRSRK